MSNRTISPDTILYWIVIGGLFLLLATPLVIAYPWFFPYVTGKNFFFRVIVEIITGAWLGLMVLNPRYRPQKGPIMGALALFVGVLTLAAIFGVDPYYSFWSNFERMEGLVTHIHLLALFFVVSSVLRREGEWKRIFTVSLGISAVIALAGFLEWGGILLLPGSVAGSVGAGRIFSTLGNSLYLSAYLLFHLFLIGFLFLRTKRTWLRSVYVLLFLFEFSILIASGSRTVLVAFLLGLLAMGISLLFFRSRGVLTRMPIVLVCLALILVGSFFLAKNTAFIQSRPLLARLSDISLSSSTVQSRFMVWGMAWNGFKERPLLGWGPENFIVPFTKYYNPNFYGNEPWFDRAHNMYLEWLVAGGIIGFFAYLILIGAVFWGMWRLGKKQVYDSNVLTVFIGLFVAYLAQNLFMFDTIVSYLLLVLFLAFLHRSSLEEQEEERETQRKEPRIFLAAFFVLLGFVGVVAVNMKPMRVVGAIIRMTGTMQRENAEHIIQEYTALISLGTFGMFEARERFVQGVVDRVTANTVSPKEGMLLLRRAIDEARLAGDRRPHVVRYKLSEGMLLRLFVAYTGKQRHWEEMLAAYLRARELAPRYIPISLGLADAYFVAEQAAAAQETLNGVYQEMTSPNIFFYSVLLADVLTGDFERGEKRIQEFLALSLEHGTGVHEGRAYLGPDEMVRIAGRSLGIGDPAERESFFEMALLSIGMDDAIGEAIYSKQIADMLIMLARTEAELGKREEVEEHIKHALRLVPEREEEIQGILETI